MIERNGGDDGARTRFVLCQQVAARAKWLCFQYASGSAVHVITAYSRDMVAHWLHEKCAGVHSRVPSARERFPPRR